MSHIKKDSEDLSVIKLNNNKSLIKKNVLNNSCNSQIKISENKNNDEIKNILIDIQNKKINNRINFSDKFLFLFAKLFKINTKKQLYLKRVEQIIVNDLSIDYIFQELKKLQKIINNNINEVNNNDKIDVIKFYNPKNTIKFK